MKKLFLILLPLLAIAGSTWADYVKIGGYELSNGGTFTNSNNTRIDEGSASLSSDGKTLTLTKMTLTTSKANGIETNRNGLKIVVVDWAYVFVSGKYGIYLEAQDVTITGNGEMAVGAKDKTAIYFNTQSASLTLDNLTGGLEISHSDYITSYGIGGKGTNNYGTLIIYNTDVTFRSGLINRSCFSDMGTVKVYGNSHITMTGNNSYATFNNVSSLYLDESIYITEPQGAFFMDEQKAIVNNNGSVCKDNIKIDFLYVVKIDEAFPDATFQAYIKSITNGDNYLTQEEINRITSIDVSGKTISDLTGIGYFTSLTSLKCNQTNIPSLNLSANTMLTELSCAFCQSLTTLALSGCNNLQTVNVAGSKLTTLDLSGKTKLKTLSCNPCTNLATLNVSNCSQLTALSVPGMYGTPLANLNLSGCSGLKTIDCHGNASLTNLNTTGCTAVTSLDCSDCAISAITIYPALKTLNCSNNRLTTLNVSECTALQNLNCSHNQLTIDANAFLENTALVTLDCSYNTKWASANIESLPELTSLNCNSCAIETICLYDLPKFTTLDCGNNAIKEFDFRECPLLTTIGSYTTGHLESIYIENTGMTQLTFNQEPLTSVVILNCNKFTSLNVTGNTSLMGITVFQSPLIQTINCTNSRLVQLDLTDLPALKNLDCSNNELEGLIDLTGCPALETLNLSNNKLIYMPDISQCTAIKSLNYSNNFLSIPSTAFDNKTSLVSIDCSNNTDWESVIVYYLPNLTSLDCSHCEATTVSIGYLNELSDLRCEGNAVKSFSMYSCPKLTSLGNLPSQSLQSMQIHESAVADLSLSTSALTYLLIRECPALQALTIQGNAEPLTIIVLNCAALNTINCSHNNVKTLSLAGLTGLKDLDCSDNDIANMDILGSQGYTGCTALENLNFSNNKVSNLYLGLFNKLKNLDCSNNLLTRLYGIYSLSDLSDVNASHNRLTGIEFDSCPNLQNVDVSHNQLTALTVNACADDAAIYCQENNLAMTAFIQGLPNKANRTQPAIYVYDGSSVTDNNVCTVADVTAAQEKGWDVYSFNGVSWQPYPGSENPAPTAVTTPETNPQPSTAPDDNHYYSLDGRRINQKPHKPGIYIHNGKKVVVK